VNCPYCRKAINAFTGFQEAAKFQKHLRTCRKNPNNLSDGRRAVALKPQTLLDALNIRAESGQ
jgi:hypothetical protein